MGITGIVVISLQEVVDNIYRLLLHARVGQLSLSRVKVEMRHPNNHHRRPMVLAQQMCEKCNQYFH